MADLYVVDVSMNLTASLPDAVLTELRRHLGLGETADGQEDDAPDDPDDPDDPGHPVWAARGPAKRIGGIRIGELAQTPEGWSLTVRQEVHAESMPQVDALVERLLLHSTTEGVIGQIRFHEDEIPELLLNRSGVLTKAPLRLLPDRNP
ncbi:hypothetical protein [Streptomyces sp. MB09-02B]|uniref:hypothetical protein n=1 Tax=Streptomyces sp. MB09-02B TaxID=3028667 RepID=UPI0029B35C5F|nr:hypothetical protein [Streptomyces sp. MB09-02B]MDX3643649.1 hypothetical protein [Streptomyces sp. MB09-02B]